MAILIHTKDEYNGMRMAGRLAAEILDYVGDFVKPGITTLELDMLCHRMIVERNAIPAPLGYKGFPKSICTSINEVVCHGIPSGRQLINGSILNIDVTVILDGWHGDASRMYIVGNDVSSRLRKLVKVTYECMMLGIETVKPGVKAYEIGKAIQSHAEKYGYSVVRNYCGHGIGREFHCEPQILHYYSPRESWILEPGMFFTIEPMINIGHYDTKILKDGWTVVTTDGKHSAQWEHTIAVTDSGYEIFTISK